MVHTRSILSLTESAPSFFGHAGDGAQGHMHMNKQYTTAKTAAQWNTTKPGKSNMLMTSLLSEALTQESISGHSSQSMTPKKAWTICFPVPS